jgi:hypothetical protein
VTRSTRLTGKNSAAVPFMVLALVLALVMPEKPLSEEMIEVAEGKAEVPEY